MMRRAWPRRGRGVERARSGEAATSYKETMSAQRVDEVTEGSAEEGALQDGENRGQRSYQRERRLGHGPADKPGGTADIWGTMSDMRKAKRRMGHKAAWNRNTHVRAREGGSSSNGSSARTRVARQR